MTLTGSGTNTYTFPSATSTLASLALAETLTSKHIGLAVGTATAGTAPLKLTQASAVVLTSPEAGAIECNDGDLLYYTIKTGPTRKTIAFLDSITVTTGNGVSATNTAGALAFTLGAITPTTINGLALSLGVNSIATNVAAGVSALAGANSGTGYNTGIGQWALKANTSGVGNSGVGAYANYQNSTGSYNFAGGYAALSSNTGGGNNTAIGTNAGNSALGSNSVFVGSSAGLYETGSNAFYVDALDRTNTAGDKAGALLYGTFNATPASQTLRVNASLSVLGLAGTGSRAVLADANGLLSAPVSDMRLKKNITPIDSDVAMRMLSDPTIQAVNYQWKDESKGDDVELGFLYQAFEKYDIKGLTFFDNGFGGINYEKISTLLWTQNVEQQKQINDLENRLKMLESK
jgi:hypothetical protein